MTIFETLTLHDNLSPIKVIKSVYAVCIGRFYVDLIAISDKKKSVRWVTLLTV